MNLRVKMMITAAVLCLFGAACGGEEQIYLEQAVAETAAAGTETAVEGDGAGEKQPAKDVPMTEEQERAQEVSAGEGQEADGICYVYLCGAVACPGVYEVPSGSRIYEVIQLAGGLTEEASAASVNQAETVSDGQMIFLPTVEEAQAGVGTDARNVSDGAAGETAEPDGRVNLNTATGEELMTLPGIGQSKADDILAYRNECGGFSSIEEIMNVTGIKEGLYNRIKDNIRVK